MKRVYPLLSLFFFMILFCFAYFHTWEVDEAWTYLSVKNESFSAILAYAHFNIANNHLLNSFWFKVMQLASAHNVIFFRLASLVSFLCYSYFLYRIVTYKTTFWSSVSDWWLVFFFLPPIMVYFTLGRGYGLATTAFLGALYYMKVWLDEKHEPDYWKFFFLACLSSLSIVSFLFPFLAMLIYIAVRTADPLFSKRNMITAILLLPLIGYIYYVGKVILLHDKIINGTDHLFINGMYATFAGALSIYDFCFPFPDLVTRFWLVPISKALVILTFLPVAWIIVRKRQARAYMELSILLFFTVLLFITHLILKAKYPSDRSIIYVLYLLYIPVISYIVRYRDKYFKLHYFTILLFSIINFCSYFYSLSRPELYATLAKEPARTYAIISDWPNQGDQVYSDLYFDGRLHFSYIAKSFETDWTQVDQKIKTILRDHSADFLLLQRSSWLRDQSLLAAWPAQKLFSSSYKELYLIRLR